MISYLSFSLSNESGEMPPESSLEPFSQLEDPNSSWAILKNSSYTYLVSVPTTCILGNDLYHNPIADIVSFLTGGLKATWIAIRESSFIVYDFGLAFDQQVAGFFGAESFYEGVEFQSQIITTCLDQGVKNVIYQIPSGIWNGTVTAFTSGDPELIGLGTVNSMFLATPFAKGAQLINTTKLSTVPVATTLSFSNTQGTLSGIMIPTLVLEGQGALTSTAVISAETAIISSSTLHSSNYKSESGNQIKKDVFDLAPELKRKMTQMIDDALKAEGATRAPESIQFIMDDITEKTRAIQATVVIKTPSARTRNFYFSFTEELGIVLINKPKHYFYP